MHIRLSPCRHGRVDSAAIGSARALGRRMMSCGQVQQYVTNKSGFCSFTFASVAHRTQFSFDSVIMADRVKAVVKEEAVRVQALAEDGVKSGAWSYPFRVCCCAC
jgi:hypothetical protein